jgi:hypothetical protein
MSFTSTLRRVKEFPYLMTLSNVYSKDCSVPAFFLVTGFAACRDGKVGGRGKLIV